MKETFEREGEFVLLPGSYQVRIFKTIMNQQTLKAG